MYFELCIKHIVLDQPKEFTVNTFSQAATCSTTCDGVSVASTLGGTGLMNSYIWDDPAGQTTAIATGLCPGTYTVIATDIKGCSDTTIAVIGVAGNCKTGILENEDVSSTEVDEQINSTLESTAFPNPFAGVTTIKYTVSESTNVELGIYDLTGKAVNILFNGEVTGGEEMTHTFDANELPQGMYFYRITTTDGQDEIGKLILTK